MANKLNGIYRLKNDADMNVTDVIRNIPAFRSGGKDWLYASDIGSAANRKIYYYDEAETQTLVWKAGTGWTKDIYRIILFVDAEPYSDDVEPWLNENCDVKGFLPIELYGVYRIKEDVNMGASDVLNIFTRTPAFRSGGRKWTGVTYSTSGSKTQLKYISHDTATPTVVWESGTGWANDYYRTILFDDSPWADEIGIWLDENCDVKGLYNIRETVWVFDDTINWPVNSRMGCKFKFYHPSPDTATFPNNEATGDLLLFNNGKLYYYDMLQDEKYHNVYGWDSTRAGQLIRIPSDGGADLDAVAFLVSVASNNAWVEYNGEVVCYLPKGKNATFHCKGCKMHSNVIVKSPPTLPCKIQYGSYTTVKSGSITIRCGWDFYVSRRQRMRDNLTIKTKY